MRQAAKSLYLLARRAALSPLRLLSPARAADVDGVRKILLIRIDRIGDMVLSTPFFANLKNQLPDAEIVLLARPFARDLLYGNKSIDRILPWPQEGDWRRRLRSERFDLAIDLHYDHELRTAALCWASGAARRAGFNIAGRGAFFNIRAAADERKHFIQETFDLLQALGLRPEAMAPRLFTDPAAERAAEACLAGQGLKPGAPLAVVHPGGFYPAQRWPAASFAAVADAVRDRYGLMPCVMGGAGERGLCEQTFRALKGPGAMFAGRELKESAALIKRARIFIGNNSGPLHMACALGVAAVSTMGPTDPVRWWPVGEKNEVVRKAALNDIEPEELAAAAARLIG
jgi:ADP-heptose:LPS heptosyltransferase